MSLFNPLCTAEIGGRIQPTVEAYSDFSSAFDIELGMHRRLSEHCDHTLAAAVTRLLFLGQQRVHPATGIYGTSLA
jgi:hypothetical protein